MPPPQILPDQLTLFQPGVYYTPIILITLLLAPPPGFSDIPTSLTVDILETTKMLYLLHIRPSSAMFGTQNTEPSALLLYNNTYYEILEICWIINHLPKPFKLKGKVTYLTVKNSERFSLGLQ